MAEYIDVEKARAYVETDLKGDPVLQWLGRTMIEKLPKNGAEANWEEWYPPKHMILTGEEMLYRCSACTAKYPDVAGYNYCPHCGARMEVAYGPFKAD